MTGTIVVLGTNAGQADLIRHMKQRSWRVVGVSPRRGEAGQAFCDVVEHVDITNLDALEDVVRRHGADLVYSVSSDVAIRAVTALSEKMDLPHFFDSAFISLLDHKARLRAFLRDHDIETVAFQEVVDPAELSAWQQFPCIVKPVDAQGQRGVVRVDSAENLSEMVAAAIKYSRTGSAIVEEYLDGVEMSCNVLLSEGKPSIKVLSERLVHGGDLMGVPQGHLVPPKNVSRDHQQAASDLVDRIVEAFGQDSGPLYFQMIVTPGGPRIVEIAPRLDGCHMWRLIKTVTGVDLLERTVDRLLGSLPKPEAFTLDPGKPMELMFQQTPPGEAFDAQRFPVPADAIYHESRYRDGDAIDAINGKLEVVGYYIREMTSP